ncbi:hypothetical protein N0V82_007594 [Gnomoniopsis sp. IMI 355080]|nr:hypothetical protein N0V82_007594 [Gnomoniopsis sp. IMI 355080]
MRIRFLIFPILLGISTVHADEDVDRIIAAIDSISNVTGTLGQALHSWTGAWSDLEMAKLPFLSHTLLKQINTATTTARKSRKLDDVESIDIQEPAHRLVADTNITLIHAIEAKQKLEENNPYLLVPGIRLTLLHTLKKQILASAQLSQAMFDVFTGSWGKDDANRTGVAIQGLFNNAIAIYEGSVPPARTLQGKLSVNNEG